MIDIPGLRRYERELVEELNHGELDGPRRVVARSTLARVQHRVRDLAEAERKVSLRTGRVCRIGFTVFYSRGRPSEVVAVIRFLDGQGGEVTVFNPTLEGIGRNG